MPTVYPAAIDAFVNPTGVDTLDSPPHDGQHADKNDAIEAIETELGINPRGAAASVRARLDALPLGQLGYAQATVDQGSISGTLVDLTSLSVAVNVAAGRRIRIAGEGLFQADAADNKLDLSIREGAVVLQIRGVTPPVAAAPDGVHAEVILTPTVGAHTYKLSAQRASGAGTFTLRAGATFPAFILVEDLGAA